MGACFGLEIKIVFVFQLLFSMDNGAGEVITTWKPTLRGTLCNGKWHTIRCKLFHISLLLSVVVLFMLLYVIHYNIFLLDRLVSWFGVIIFKTVLSTSNLYVWPEQYRCLSNIQRLHLFLILQIMSGLGFHVECVVIQVKRRRTL